MKFGPGLLRLLLACAVFIAHVSRLNIGRPAVMVFFILSGYWVTTLYVKRRGSIAVYILDRFLRIWPLLAIIAISWTLIRIYSGNPYSGDLSSTLALLGLASRLDDDVLSVAWSLDVEMQFYLALPFVVWFVSYSKNNREIVFLVAALLTTAVGVLLLSQGLVTALVFAPSFLSGVMIAYWKPKIEPGQAIGSILVFASIGALLYALPQTRHVIIKPSLTWYFDFIETIWTLSLVPFVAWALDQTSNSLDRLLGDLTFPFYLVHCVVVAMVSPAIAPYTGVHALKIFLFVIAFGAASAIYFLIDRPIERWRVGLRLHLQNFTGVRSMVLAAIAQK